VSPKLARIQCASVSSSGGYRNPGTRKESVMKSMVRLRGLRLFRVVAAVLMAAAWLSVGPLAAGTPWSVEGDQESSAFGYSVGTAGDVNGDGYADVIVGAFNYDNGQTDEGRAFVYLGSAAGLSSAAAWTSEVDEASAQFGGAVATAGDVNGDGYADVIVGAWPYQGVGRADVFLGSASGLSALPAWTAIGDPYGFGFSVATAGDVNGDGYADVIVGSLYYSNGQDYEGAAFVYLGSASGLSDTPAWKSEGDQVAANLSKVASAGDVNGDGYSDVIVAAPYYDARKTDAGRALVYLGSPSGLATTPAWTAEGNQNGERFGDSVASAGDVNGDGYSDVLVGAPLHDNALKDQGRVLLYLGSASGLATSSAWTADGETASELYGLVAASAGDVDADGYSDVIVGKKGDVYLGSPSGLASSPAWTAAVAGTVATAGDVDGDGYADVIVGDSGYSNDQLFEGRAVVYLGPLGGDVPATFGGSVTGLTMQKVICQDRTTGGKVGVKASGPSWDCEALGLAVETGDRVQTNARGTATGGGSIGGSVTRMNTSSVFCQNITAGTKVEVASQVASWDCGAMGFVVSPGDTVVTGAAGTVR
jgi:hypothetical protein